MAGKGDEMDQIDGLKPEKNLAGKRGYNPPTLKCFGEAKKMIAAGSEKRPEAGNNGSKKFP